eukprot:scaffold7381_cov310-Pinguiococcus_pyrenoidosus.AAC.82
MGSTDSLRYFRVSASTCDADWDMTLLSPGKKNAISRLAESSESDPWVAFAVLFEPKSARTEHGASFFATSALVGPCTARHVRIAPSRSKMSCMLFALDMY